MSTAVTTVSPVTLPAPGRGEDLQVRISAPTTGHDLPVIVFSHGFGESLRGYGPLVDYWAAQGFAVIQPTHLDSRTLDLPPDDPRTPRIWRFRVEDLIRVLDHLEELDVNGRLDRTRIAVAGHSWGAQTASMLLGARVADEDFPFMNPSFAEMPTPALIVAGDKDQSLLSVRGPDWFTDAYHLSPGD